MEVKNIVEDEADQGIADYLRSCRHNIEDNQHGRGSSTLRSHVRLLEAFGWLSILAKIACIGACLAMIANAVRFLLIANCLLNPYGGILMWSVLIAFGCGAGVVDHLRGK